MSDLITRVPEELRPVYSEIVALTDAFCREKLDDECRELCQEMAVRLCQQGSPVVRGKPTHWACGIVYSVGWVNLLTDPDQQPHLPAAAIADGFGVSAATMQANSEIIREGLGLAPCDADFWRPSRRAEHPLAWSVEINGVPLDARGLAPEVQQAAFEDGLIPFVPAERQGREAA